MVDRAASGSNVRCCTITQLSPVSQDSVTCPVSDYEKEVGGCKHYALILGMFWSFCVNFQPATHSCPFFPPSISLITSQINFAPCRLLFQYSDKKIVTSHAVQILTLINTLLCNTTILMPQINLNKECSSCIFILTKRYSIMRYEGLF